MIESQCKDCGRRIVSPDGNGECGVCELGSQGLGDDVQSVINKLGGRTFKKVYKIITGLNCNCPERRRLLNRLFPSATFSHKRDSSS